MRIFLTALALSSLTYADFGMPVRIFNPHRCVHIKTLMVSRGATGCAFSPDGRTLALAGSDGSIRLWETKPWRLARSLKGHTAEVRSVHFSRDGRSLISAGLDGTIRLWDTNHWKEERLMNVGTPLLKAAFAPDGRRLVSATTDGQLHLWDSAGGALVKNIAAHAGGIHGVSWSRNGQILATTGLDCHIKIWDTASWECRRKIEWNGVPYGIALSNDGHRMAFAGTPNVVRLYTRSSDTVGKDLKIAGAPVMAILFSPDERYLLASTHQSLTILDSGTGRKITELEGHSGTINDVSISPDGQWLATLGSDYSVRIWGQGRAASKNVARGFLGVSINDTADQIGAKIVDIIPDSAAQRDGFQVEDVVLAVDGAPVNSTAEVIDAIGSHAEGEEIEVCFSRNTVENTRTVKLGKRPENLDR